MLPKQDSLRGVRRFAYFAILGGTAALSACSAADNIPTGGNPDLACSEDATCSVEAGAGSICLGGTCSKNAKECDPSALVVVEQSLDEPSNEDLADACHFRKLDEALSTVDGATRLIVLGDRANASSPITLPEGLSFEGRSSDPARPVELNISKSTADAALVTISKDASIKGFAIDGAGQSRGVLVRGSQASLRGPIEIRDATIAVELAAGSSLTVEGSAQAPARFSRNGVGIVVPDKASLTLRGDGDQEGLVIEDTSKGAGLIVLSGGADAIIDINGLLARRNQGSDGSFGTGALEVRRGRLIKISNSFFSANVRALNLNGETFSVFDSFDGVSLEGNTFESSGVEASLICGAALGSVTKLRLEAGNTFDGISLSTSQECGSLESSQVSTCEQAKPLGFTGASNPFDIACELLP